jgi:hypothetical protein
MMSSRCLAQPQQKTIGYVWIFRSSMKSTFQRIKRKAIGGSYKRIFLNRQWLHVLKFWTASSAEVKQP